MADNSTLPATGDVIADEDISGVKYQRVKLIDATVGSTTPVGTSANPLKVAEVEPDATSLLSTTISAAGVSASIDTSGWPAIVAQISGTWHGLFFFEASNDGTSWDTILTFSRDNLSLQDTMTSGGLYTVRPSGRYVRVNVPMINGSMVVVALGRRAEGIAASDLLSLAMDRSNNTPLQVQLNGVQQDLSGALVPPADTAFSFPFSPGLNANGLTGQPGWLDVSQFSMVCFTLVGNSASGAYVLEGSNDGEAFFGLLAYAYVHTGGSASVAGTGVYGSTNTVPANVTWLIPVVSRYVRMRFTTAPTAAGIAHTRLSRSPVPAINGGVVLSGIPGTQGLGTGSTGHIPIAGMIKLALAAPRSDASTYYPALTEEGHTIVRQNSQPQLCWSFASIASGILNTTVATTIKAAVAGQRGNLASLQIQHEPLGAATELVVRDGAAGAVMFRMKLPLTTAQAPILIHFNPPLRQAAVNTLMEVATLTASITGAVYVNAQGFQSN